jgi:Protein of unknown function (DUF732)
MTRTINKVMIAAAQVIWLGYAAVLGLPTARADVTAFLVNVTVRPGYNFANAAEALAYGQALCARIDAGQPYAELVASVKADFNTPDEYQASYLIAQAADELCPALIWQLRNSAAGYRPAAT